MLAAPGLLRRLQPGLARRLGQALVPRLLVVESTSRPPWLRWPPPGLPTLNLLHLRLLHPLGGQQMMLWPAAAVGAAAAAAGAGVGPSQCHPAHLGPQQGPAAVAGNGRCREG